MAGTSSRVATWASCVKFEHTLFSLPMLYAGAVVAAGAFPDLRTALWILGAGTGARTAAMGLNRIIDRNIDARNPRTDVRELPRGAMKLGEAVYKDTETPDGKSEGMADMAGMAPGGDGPAADEDAPEPDNIVDAEFEELDDEDKNQRSN